ncbi:MAG: hypothetical protein C5B54_10000 [Acidobacteria bacterium]|nr:MAG: hypothetical protein C5B54_10000 [Acidobacteriota bacterium]
MGIAQIMEVVAVGKRVVRFRQSLARSISSILVISTGGSEGREGPIIQMGAAFASVVARGLRVSPERARVLVACGMAAGVAGAYNTPISATLFVVELVMGSFTMAVFGPAIISAFVSALLTQTVLGKSPLYHVPPFEINLVSEVIPCIVLGLLSGLSSVLFVRTLRWSKKLFKRSGLKDEWRMALGGLGVGIIGLYFPEVWGNGFEGTNHLLKADVVLWFFVALFGLKILATALTIGSGGVGGVFTPALMTGAALGGSIAIVFNQLFPYFTISVPGYMLMGMGGLLAGTTRAPFLGIIMMFELTQNQNLVLPMMIVSIVAISGAKLFERESLYVEELKDSGVEWKETPETSALANMKVKEIVRRDVGLIPANVPLSEIIKIFLQTRAFYVFVGDSNGRLQGVIDLHDLKEFIGDTGLSDPDTSRFIIAADLVREVPMVTPEESLASATEKLWLRDLGWLPVVDSEKNRKFLGIITRRDLLGAFDREALRNSRFFTRVRTDLALGNEVGYFELPEHHRLVQVELPHDFYGLSLAEADFRRRFGVSVLAVKRLTRDGHERRFVPTPEDRLEKGDVLIMLATDEATERLQKGVAYSQP